jgi:hypothetical protein
MCRFCALRARLEELYPDASWDEIKERLPGLARSWPDGYEPLSLRVRIGVPWAEARRQRESVRT